jgi:hypothetical protein
MPHMPTDSIMPGQGTPGDFQPFETLTLDEEFELVAPLHVFHHVDLRFEARANAARRQLRRLGHPLARMGGEEADASRQRYNALMLAIAREELPGVEACIDARGALAFQLRDDGHRVLVGDRDTFTFAMSPGRVRERLRRMAKVARGSPGGCQEEEPAAVRAGSPASLASTSLAFSEWSW